MAWEGGEWLDLGNDRRTGKVREIGDGSGRWVVAPTRTGVTTRQADEMVREDGRWTEDADGR